MKVKDAFIIDQPREVLNEIDTEAELDNDPSYLAWTKEMDEDFKRKFGLQEPDDKPAF